MPKYDNVIQIKGVTAKDSQCGEPINGNLIVALEDQITGATICTGSLLKSCIEHHIKNKMPNVKGNIPQHDEFEIFEGEIKVGNIIIASTATEAGIELSEGTWVHNKIAEQVAEFANDRGRRS
jgi:hypothetical protein